jgi:putative transposase
VLVKYGSAHPAPLGTKKRIYNTRAIALEDVTDYIQSFYNPKRRHAHLGGVSPDQFEASFQP